jgi:hypothetical protein
LDILEGDRGGLRIDLVESTNVANIALGDKVETLTYQMVHLHLGGLRGIAQI